MAFRAISLATQHPKDIDMYHLNLSLDALMIYLNPLELKMSMRQVRDTLGAINTVSGHEMASSSAESKGEFIAKYLRHLINMIVNELEDRMVCYFNDDETKFLVSGNSLFDPLVIGAFPSAKNDLEEAAQCLGHARYTACVFHLMRAMETAVRKIADHLNAEIVDEKGHLKTWQGILDAINKEVKGMSKGADKNRWSEVSALLYNAKNAWRNDTMHPNKEELYTEHSSRDVFEAVRSFMNRLALELEKA